jgi:predicted nucleic acid-binding protein
MKVFVDTSGIFALLVKNDSKHLRAKESFNRFAQNKAHLYASSFVLVETTALLHKRIGLDAVRDFNTKFLPLLEIIWTDKEWYARSIHRLFLQSQKDVSLVDCLSFEIMESFDISLAFSFDKRFEDMGFSIVG